ncbi:2-succinyl-5-enolpyruvyl-6-hydroxy-3-cyclohexene-1-carboxylic-acid synthase [Prolixibacteraceae bacterium Z1-6]|uniref:2-succinyl-5-enolpyruvyl-6-hydroxy-3-cyclohexene-1-carboxylate synthase n=1 Tax=Draconibacterium aestuarii TaxID=2998507 RepID=A0A9X3J411_9BACT|nr:2-succinyl-5-enolpyruvyl-6-hydroxy-3-cyclohexene-1-carboxylic-acid synthase [Prolixibacteraceae bacterium Z1-6]
MERNRTESGNLNFGVKKGGRMNAKSHIPLMASLLKAKGVKHVVIAPGSRNAPLIQSFFKEFGDKCLSIVDERSAGYFALGIALKSQTPVVVITTSGTAALNLAPAIAEAFYQGVPLITITADRPAEWIGQQDNQVIHQQNIFGNNCKASFELPVECTCPEDLWLSNRIVNEAYNKTIAGKSGPVHINVPLREPLYDELPVSTEHSIIETIAPAAIEINEELVTTWKKAKRILIVCGQQSRDQNLNVVLNQFTKDSRVVVLSESTGNVRGENILHNPDLLFQHSEKELINLKPELVVYYGGQVVSKRIKTYLRTVLCEFWYVSPGGLYVDTFKRLSKVIQADVAGFFTSLYKKVESVNGSDYSQRWQLLYAKALEAIGFQTKNVEFSDLWVTKQIANKLQPEAILFAGNSSMIRYLQFFQNNSLEVFANRGTSGIDGCVSTAAGIAKVTDKKVFAVVGDLSFVYDSNGLWNKSLSANLKIIVVNNKGGGIFSMIPGPAQQMGFEEFFQAHHPVSIKKITEAFNLDYTFCSDAESFEKSFLAFSASKKAAVLEIETLSDINTRVFTNFVKNLKNEYK